MTYEPRSDAPGYWSYAGLPIQADVETHRFAVDFAVRSLAPGSRVLDVAAGHGALSKSLLDHGFDVSCTSWNDRVDLNVPTYRIDLDHAFEASQVGGVSFCSIFCVEVIEHVENPAQFLRSIAGLLTQDGYVVLSTPNVESAPARLEWLFRGCPYSFDGTELSHNRHISIMWRQGLEMFIRLAGFDIVEKQLLGPIRYANRFQFLTKRPIYALMRTFLRGELDGNTRLYVLRRNKNRPVSLGADQVA